MVYDLEWNPHPEYLCYSDHFKRQLSHIPRPQSLDKMIESAKTLSKGFPEVRVDFYDINGKPYFGELTFTAACGRMQCFTQEYLSYFGEKIIL